MKVKKNGYVLIEVLVASVLLGLISSGLCFGLLQCVKTDQRIRSMNKAYMPVESLWARLEKDLRNSVYLRQVLYEGRQNEMSFPTVINRRDAGEAYSELYKIKYFIQSGNLIRSEQKLSNSLAKSEPRERSVLKNIENLKFQYAYLDERDELIFKPVWLEEPYLGIPIAVKLELKMKDLESFSKLIWVPQGRWGHLQ